VGSKFGTKVRRLREQADISQEALAGLAGISREWLAKIESGRDPKLSVIVKVAAALASCIPAVTLVDLFEGYEAIPIGRPARRQVGSWAVPRMGDILSATDIERLTALNAVDELGQTDALRFGSWIQATNTSDDLIESLHTATSIATRDHVYLPTTTVLTKVLGIHQQIRTVLQGGRQRLHQSRDLFRIDAGLLAHICLLFGDLRRDDLAAAYGAVAIFAANEAGANPAEAFSAQAQIARWRHRYTEAADLASHGFACSPPTSLRVLLACQEANAAAVAGDARRARHALAQAEAARVNPMEEGLDSVWSCPPARYAAYRAGVALYLGDTATALQEADIADAAWVRDRPPPYGTWAHVRMVAGHAHLMSGAVDGAAEEIEPVLDLSPEFRLATLTAHMTTVERLLVSRRFRDSAEAARLRERIDEFNRNSVWGKQ
jgi:transcriptional regulator with XRE-family HTH domain